LRDELFVARVGVLDEKLKVEVVFVEVELGSRGVGRSKSIFYRQWM